MQQILTWSAYLYYNKNGRLVIHILLAIFKKKNSICSSKLGEKQTYNRIRHFLEVAHLICVHFLTFFKNISDADPLSLSALISGLLVCRV